MARRKLLVIVMCTLLLAGLVLLRLALAPDIVNGGASIEFPMEGQDWSLRGARVASALTVGTALAVAGVLLQALLRNPLAAPSVLGLTSGASLGVVISLYVGFLVTGQLNVYHRPVVPALIGAFATLAIVYTLGQRRGLIHPVSLILVGVVISVICGAAIEFIQQLLPDRGWTVAMQWRLGAISDDLSWTFILIAAAMTLVLVGVSVALAPALDAMSLGDDEAIAVGTPLGQVRMICFGIAGILATIAVAVAGPIGFVGLICPHVVRVLAGPSHRSLLIGAALAGPCLVIAADVLVRAIDLGAGRMPIGVLTAMVGGPLFLLLIRRGFVLK